MWGACDSGNGSRTRAPPVFHRKNEESKMKFNISLYALGIPGVAVVTSTQQTADNKGDDMNDAKQTNPVSVKLPTK